MGRMNKNRNVYRTEKIEHVQCVMASNTVGGKVNRYNHYGKLEKSTEVQKKKNKHITII